MYPFNQDCRWHTSRNWLVTIAGSSDSRIGVLRRRCWQHVVEHSWENVRHFGKGSATVWWPFVSSHVLCAYTDVDHTCFRKIREISECEYACIYVHKMLFRIKYWWRKTFIWKICDISLTHLALKMRAAVQLYLNCAYSSGGRKCILSMN